MINLQYHTIQVIDKETKLTIPMVKLTTVNHISRFTDSNGIVSFYEPGFMNEIVWFFVESMGYWIDPIPVFNLNGLSFNLSENGKTVIEINRINKAERLYRVTGNGIYDESYKIGIVFDIPLNYYNVQGQDSVQTVVYKNKYWWIWGDTLKTSFPLGNFHGTAAVTSTDLDLNQSPKLDYFRSKDNFVKEIAPIEPLTRPTWLGSITVINNKMYSLFYKPNVPQWTTGDYGYSVWNDEKEIFVKIRDINRTKEFIYPFGGSHPIKDNGFVYFGCFCYIRIKEKEDCYTNFSCYESYSPLKEGTSSYDLDNLQLDFDTHGRLIYDWKKNTGVLNPKEQHDLLSKRMIKEEDAIYILTSIDTGEKIVPASTSLSFNKYLNKYICIIEQLNGSNSFMGEIWFAWSNSLEGRPWKYTQKIVTQDRLDFYNVREHSVFAKDNFIFFEGTFSSSFDRGEVIPKYNYNNQMYRLNLDRIHLPVEIYKNFETGEYRKKKESALDILQFFAYEKNKSLLIPVCQKKVVNQAKYQFQLFFGDDCSNMNDEEVLFFCENDISIYDPSLHLFITNKHFVFKK